MNATRIFAQRRGNTWAEDCLGWYTVGALVLLSCLAIGAAWLIVSAPVPVDAESASAMMGR